MWSDTEDVVSPELGTHKSELRGAGGAGSRGAERGMPDPTSASPWPAPGQPRTRGAFMPEVKERDHCGGL